jgi:ActR/RegA family two-component response regulator
VERFDVTSLGSVRDMEKYKAIVLDDQETWRDVLVKTLRRRDFDVVGYGEAESLLTEVFDVIQPPDDQPDLVVVDLKLESEKMQGIDLVKLLMSRDLACVIVAITGDIESEFAEEAMKLGAAVVGKRADNFLTDNFLATIQKMERLAEIGRKRRLYRMSAGTTPHENDPSRLHRPVFLSYSNRDTRIANGLRNNLEMQGIDVWYAPTKLLPGDPWTRCIDEAIDHASVFVALNTNSSVLSPECIAEFMRFHRRLERNLVPRPLIVPVRYELSTSGKASEALQIFDSYQYVDLSVNYVDRMNELIMLIKGFLARGSGMSSAPSTDPGRVA